MKKNTLILLTTCLLALTACGGDKSLKEHQKQETDAECARLGKAAGNYRGGITSQRTGESIGGFETSLEVRRVPADTGEASTVDKCRLEGRVTVFSRQQSTAVLELAQFTSDGDGGNGSFSGRISVPADSGSAVQLSLNGTIANGAFSGTLTPTSRPGTAASFSLVKDGALVNDGQNSVDPDPSRSEIYSGSFRDPNCTNRNRGCRGGDTVSVRMRLSRNPQNGNQAFLNHFLDNQLVGIQLNFDQTTLALPGAELNERAGTIRFQGIVQGSISTQATLACQRLNAGWRCSYASGSFGISYNFDVMPGGR